MSVLASSRMHPQLETLFLLLHSDVFLRSTVNTVDECLHRQSGYLCLA